MITEAGQVLKSSQAGRLRPGEEPVSQFKSQRQYLFS